MFFNAEPKHSCSLSCRCCAHPVAEAVSAAKNNSFLIIAYVVASVVSREFSGTLLRAVAQFQMGVDHHMLHAVVAVHLVVEQPEGLDAHFFQVLLDE